MDYLVANTTREERLTLVKKAFAISITESKMPTDETFKIIRQYIDGKKELAEVQKEIEDMYANLIPEDNEE